MAGIVPRKRSYTGRKQWTLHDGPTGSLKRLRNQLANDGCAESQVVLAKQLLEEECDHEGEKHENDRLGVYWLIKASEQGNVEATELLKNCLANGKGINDHNYMDVHSCINMTQDEKVARKAAREMFASLSNGEDYITSHQLQKRMLEIDKEQGTSGEVQSDDYKENCNELVNNRDEIYCDDKQDRTWSQKTERYNQKLTEENMVSAAVDYSHGLLPVVSNILSLNDAHFNVLDRVPFVHRSIRHPLLAMKLLYYRLIKYLGCRSFLSYFPIIKGDLQLLLLVFIYCFVSANSFLHFFPMVAYYVTFSIMLITTFQMLQVKRDYQDFRLWSGLFITYSGGSLNAQEAEYQFIRNNLKPYGHFFIALLLNLVIYPVIADQWIPQSELTVISFCLTFMTLLSFMARERDCNVPDFLVLFSFALNVLAKYPYETDPVVTRGWRFLDLRIPTFTNYIIGNGIEFCINFRAIFYVFIPVVLVRIASRQNWRGTYKVLIPHCVTLSWLQIVIINSQGATMFGLVRATLALVGIVLFLPLAGLTTIILPAIALTKWLATTVSIFSLTVFVCFVVFGLFVSWIFSKSRYSQYVAFLQILIGIVTFLLLASSLHPNATDIYLNDHDDTHSISWEQFQNFCHRPAWEVNTIVATQMRCSKLSGVVIEWEGYVNEVKIKSITNSWKTIFDRLPNSLSSYLYCLRGEPIEHDCEDQPELFKDDCLMLYDAIKTVQKCSLEKFNQYEFEISVRMHSGLWGQGAEVVLNANEHFRNFSLELKSNDKIRFNGLLINTENVKSDGILGGGNPHVILQEISCITCDNAKLAMLKVNSVRMVNVQNLGMHLYLGIKFVLNFLFFPIVVFK